MRTKCLNPKLELESGLSLKEAYRKLLDLYNEMYSDERPYAPNWGLAVIQSSPVIFGALPTRNNGARSFTYDDRSYSIELEENKNRS